MSIQLRDRYIPEIITSNNIIINGNDNWDAVLCKCRNLLYLDEPGIYNINRPRGWGKTFLCIALMNDSDKIVMLCRTDNEEIRVRRNYNIIAPNRYNIYGYTNFNKLLGLSWSWLLMDDLREEQVEEIKYYCGFRLNKCIRIGTNG